MLTAGTGGAEYLHFNIRRIDLHIYLFHLRKHCHSSGRGMHSAAGLGFRHTLHTVYTGLIFQAGISTPTVNNKVRFLHAAQLRFGVVHQFNVPTLLGSVHGVHSKQTVSKQGAFLAAHTAADLHDNALFVVGIFGQKQDLQLLIQILLSLFRRLIGLLTKLLHLRVAHQFLGICHIPLCGTIGMVCLHDGLQIIPLPQGGGRFFGVIIKVRLFRPGADLLIAVCHRRQLVQHGSLLNTHFCYCTNFCGKCKDKTPDISPGQDYFFGR